MSSRDDGGNDVDCSHNLQRNDVTDGTTTRQRGMRRKVIGSSADCQYEKRAEIGRGTYGAVYDGIALNTGRRVAIKKVIGKKEAGEAEAALLRACQHHTDHVIELLDVVHHHGKVFLILEYMDTDLETIIKAHDQVPHLEIAQVKAYLRMLLRGVRALHDLRIVHRDLKPNNLLISKTQRAAKIADFGMATRLQPDQDGQARSIQVVTRAYRAPELFFGDDKYGFSVDMWSVGCIFAELLLRRPYFDGSSDIDQLSLIFTALGSPTENGWTDAENLPFFMRFKDTNPKPLSEQFPDLSDGGRELLSGLLQMDPKKRLTAVEALNHPFFAEEPLPAEPNDLVIVEPPEPTKKRTLAEILAATHDDDGSAIVVKGRRIW